MTKRADDTLTPDQAKATAAFSKWLAGGGRQFCLAGHAGTGKTALAVQWIRGAKRRGLAVAVCCPTNRAARVLEAKGAPVATTIHRLLYIPDDAADADVAELEERKAERQSQYDGLGNKSTAAAKKALRDIENLDARIALAKQPKFNDKSVPGQWDLVFVDEASMVSKQIIDDLRRHEQWRVVYIGDPGQLPPVSESGTYHKMLKDATLTQVVRHDDSGLLDFATCAREKRVWGRQTDAIREHDLQSILDAVTEGAASDDPLASGVVALSHSNATRMAVNSMVRARLGRKGQHPLVGDVIQATQTSRARRDKPPRLFTGSCYVVRSIERWGDGDDDRLPFRARLEDEAGDDFVALVNPRRFEWAALGSFDKDSFAFAKTNCPMRARRTTNSDAAFMEGAELLVASERGKKDTIDTWRVPVFDFDFGYCMTVHKAQGGEWDTVALIDDYPWKKDRSVDYGRWLYTAATRSSRRLMLYSPRWNDFERRRRDPHKEQSLRQRWKTSGGRSSKMWAYRALESAKSTHNSFTQDDVERAYMALAQEEPESNYDMLEWDDVHQDARLVLYLALDAWKQNLADGKPIAPARTMFDAACEMRDAKDPAERLVVAERTADRLRAMRDGESYAIALEKAKIAA